MIKIPTENCRLGEILLFFMVDLDFYREYLDLPKLCRMWCPNSPKKTHQFGQKFHMSRRSGYTWTNHLNFQKCRRRPLKKKSFCSLPNKKRETTICSPLFFKQTSIFSATQSDHLNSSNHPFSSLFFGSFPPQQRFAVPQVHRPTLAALCHPCLGFDPWERYRLDPWNLVKL